MTTRTLPVEIIETDSTPCSYFAMAQSRTCLYSSSGKDGEVKAWDKNSRWQVGCIRHGGREFQVGRPVASAHDAASEDDHNGTLFLGVVEDPRGLIDVVTKTGGSPPFSRSPSESRTLRSSPGLCRISHDARRDSPVA